MKAVGFIALLTGGWLSLLSAQPKEAPEITAKLDGLVLAVVQMEKLPLEEAVQRLLLQAHELDRASPPQARGVGAFIAPFPDGYRPSRVTLKLEKVTLRQAFQKLAEHAGLEFQVDAFKLILKAKQSARK